MVSDIWLRTTQTVREWKPAAKTSLDTIPE